MLVGSFLSFDVGGNELYGPWNFPLIPELAQSLSLIGAAAAHQLGVRGKGVSVIVIDNFTRNRKDPCNDLKVTKTATEVLDVDGNHLLGDEEILEAVRFWITAQRVPGSDRLIGDVVIFGLIELWIAGATF